MNIRKTIFLSMLGCFSLGTVLACTNDKEEDTVVGNQFILSSELLDMSVNPLTVNVGTSGKEYEINVETQENVTWQVKVKEGADVIDVTPEDIQVGSGVIKISFPENQTKEVKKASVLISSVTDVPQQEIIFQQEGLSEFASFHFAVMADLHYGIAYTGEDPVVKITRALNLIKKKQPDLQALFVCGDFTNSGLDNEYQQVTELIENNLPASVDVYYMLGNHDKYAGEASLNAYKTYTGQPYYQYIEKNGYPCITISADPTNERDANYHADAVEFLRNSLSDAARTYPGKPIFVFSHAPSRQTAWGPGWGYDDLHNVLRGYPQVIHFTGHTHYPTEDPRSFWQQYYTWINVGPSNYGTISMDVTGCSSDEMYPQSGHTITEALLVDVDGNMDVAVKRLDTYNEVDLGMPWVIASPHDGMHFSYRSEAGMEGIKNRADKNEAPIMVGELSVDKVTEYICQLSFEQGRDDDFVYHYNVEVSDKTTGEQVYAKKLFSDYYWRNGNEPHVMTYIVSGLQPGTEYRASVKAVDSYFSESIPLEVEFKTQETTVDPGGALKADLLNVVFTQAGASNALSENGLAVIQEGVCETRYDEDLRMYVGCFNGLDDKNYCWVDYSNNSFYKNGIADGFTWEIYCSTVDLSAEQYILSGSEGSSGMMIVLNYPWSTNLGNNANTYCIVAGSANDGTNNAYKFLETNLLEAGKYYHLLFTWDGGRLKLYLNGQEATAVDYQIKMVDVVEKQRIGIGTYTSSSWGKLNGNIAFARVYNKVLNDDEVAQLYTQVVERAGMEVFDRLYELLAGGTLDAALSEKGWSLMNDLGTTTEEVEAFMAGIMQ